VVGALLYWDRTRSTTDEATRAKTRLVPGFDSGAADAIAIERGGATIRLKREGDAWWLVEPHRRTEQASVDALLGALEFGMLERRIVRPDETVRKNAAIDPPRVTLTLGKTRLSVGADAPGRGVYLQRAGEPDLLVAEHRLIELTDVAADDWISKRLSVTNSDDAHTISIGPITLERGAASWRLTAPKHARAAEARVAALRKLLAEARAVRLVAGGAGTIPIALDGKAEAQLGGDCPGRPDERLVSRSDGAVLCFAKSALAGIDQSPDALRERRPFPLELDAITTVDGELDGQAISLRRAEGIWRITAPLDSAAVADDARVREWLRAILAVSASGFAPALEKPRGRLHLDEIDARLGGATVQPKGDDDSLVVGDALVRLLRAPLAEHFRSRRVLTFARPELVKVEVEESGTRRETPAFGEPLADLHAESFLPPSAPLVPARTIHITLKSGTHALALTRDCTARLDGKDPPFRLDAPTCATLLR
jgi:hypothetical protein